MAAKIIHLREPAREVIYWRETYEALYSGYWRTLCAWQRDVLRTFWRL